MNFFKQRSAWLILALTILLVLTIRVRLRDMPLERDEGEYAYAGQLILQGVPPYKDAYNMKLPGTYAAYAVIMAVFGQTPSAIHLGVALINITSILLIFLIGRKILDEPAGIVAAISYALLSTSQSVLGLAGHATHFVVLPALAGTLLLLAAREKAIESANQKNSKAAEDSRTPKPCGISGRPEGAPASWSAAVLCRFKVGSETLRYSVFLAGLLFGLAFLMKQHGIFFGIFGGLYLAFSHIYQPHTLKEKWEQNPQFRGRIGKSGSDRKEAQTSATEDQSLLTSSPTSQDTNSLQSTNPSIHQSSSQHSTTPPLHHFAREANSPVRVGPRYGTKLDPIAWPRLFKDLALFSAGFVTPYLLTCLILWAAGVFPQFTFWTITYARKYATAMPSGIGNDAVRTTLDTVTGANVLLWIIPWVGTLLMAWEKRLVNEHRFFLVALLLCSFGSISVGFYFRQHYFITLLPVMALLTGLAVSRALRLVKHDTTIELFLALPIFLLFGLGCLISLGGNGAIWFAQSPTEVVENTYGTTLFTEARKLADYLRNNPPTLQPSNTPSINPPIHQSINPTIAVLGSEPETYFYSHRRSATGYIYMYPLVETHPYAAQMQQQLIDEVETNKPAYIVYVDYRFSWNARPESSRVFDHWWQNYSANLELIQTIDIKPPAGADVLEEAQNAARGHLLLYRPKP